MDRPVTRGVWEDRFRMLSAWAEFPTPEKIAPSDTVRGRDV